MASDDRELWMRVAGGLERVSAEVSEIKRMRDEDLKEHAIGRARNIQAQEEIKKSIESLSLQMQENMRHADFGFLVTLQRLWDHRMQIALVIGALIAFGILSAGDKLPKLIKAYRQLHDGETVPTATPTPDQIKRGKR